MNLHQPKQQTPPTRNPLKSGHSFMHIFQPHVNFHPILIVPIPPQAIQNHAQHLSASLTTTSRQGSIRFPKGWWHQDSQKGNKDQVFQHPQINHHKGMSHRKYLAMMHNTPNISPDIWHCDTTCHVNRGLSMTRKVTWKASSIPSRKRAQNTWHLNLLMMRVRDCLRREEWQHEANTRDLYIQQGYTDLSNKPCIPCQIFPSLNAVHGSILIKTHINKVALCLCKMSHLYICTINFLQHPVYGFLSSSTKNKLDCKYQKCIQSMAIQQPSLSKLLMSQIHLCHSPFFSFRSFLACFQRLNPYCYCPRLT